MIEIKDLRKEHKKLEETPEEVQDLIKGIQQQIKETTNQIGRAHV